MDEKIPEKKCYACKFGGNKYYNYGFMRGTALYCRKENKWLHDVVKCPLELEKTNEIIDFINNK